ncbi:hypothetical protein MRX96_023667 [Rhipicephalus microplus]
MGEKGKPQTCCAPAAALSAAAFSLVREKPWLPLLLPAYESCCDGEVGSAVADGAAQQQGGVDSKPWWLSEQSPGLLPHPDNNRFSPPNIEKNNTGSGTSYYSPWNQPSPCQRPGGNRTTTNGITQVGRQLSEGNGTLCSGGPPSEAVMALDDMVSRLVDDDHGMPYQQATRGLLTTRQGVAGGGGGVGRGHYEASTGQGFSLPGLGNGILSCSREGSNDGKGLDLSSLALACASEAFTQDALGYLSSLGGGGPLSNSNVSGANLHQQASLLNIEDCQPLQNSDSVGPAWATAATGAKWPVPPTQPPNRAEHGV